MMMMSLFTLTTFV